MGRTLCLPLRAAPDGGECLLCGSHVSEATDASVTCRCNGHGLVTKMSSRGTVLPPPSGELKRRHEAPGVFHSACFKQHKSVAVTGGEPLTCPRCKYPWAAATKADRELWSRISRAAATAHAAAAGGEGGSNDSNSGEGGGQAGGKQK